MTPLDDFDQIHFQYLDVEEVAFSRGIIHHFRAVTSAVTSSYVACAVCLRSFMFTVARVSQGSPQVSFDERPEGHLIFVDYIHRVLTNTSLGSSIIFSTFHTEVSVEITNFTRSLISEELLNCLINITHCNP